MKEVSDFISSVGFPILVCLIMIYQQEKLSQSYIDIVESLSYVKPEVYNERSFRFY